MITSMPISQSNFVSNLIEFTKDLSNQIDGIKDTFEIGEYFSNLKVFYNGVNENLNIVNITELTFKLNFIPTLNRKLFVIYNKI